ncbi:hypothetical protein Dimus_022516 [Dionaea muscipula]
MLKPMLREVNNGKKPIMIQPQQCSAISGPHGPMHMYHATSDFKRDDKEPTIMKPDASTRDNDPWKSTAQHNSNSSRGNSAIHSAAAASAVQRTGRGHVHDFSTRP